MNWSEIEEDDKKKSDVSTTDTSDKAKAKVDAATTDTHAPPQPPRKHKKGIMDKIFDDVDSDTDTDSNTDTKQGSNKYTKK